MFGLLLLVLLAIPVVELWLAIQVAHQIGAFNTLVLLIAVSIAGAWLLKQQGRAAWARLQEALGRGEVPTKEAADGAMILLGGALLLVPGFLTDAIGLVLLTPPARSGLRGLSRRLLTRWARRRVPRGMVVYPTTVTKVTRNDPDAKPGLPDASPPKALGGPEAGSPDT